jgi:acyl carrier protein
MQGKTEIREFLQGLLTSYGDSAPFHDSEPLLSGGRLQSIDAVEIVMFLEQKFGVDFATIGFDRDRIDSVDAITDLVESFKSADKRSE